MRAMARMRAMALLGKRVRKAVDCGATTVANPTAQGRSGNVPKDQGVTSPPSPGTCPRDRIDTDLVKIRALDPKVPKNLFGLPYVLDLGAAGVAPDIDSVTSTSIAWRDTDGDAYSLSLSGGNLLLAVNGGASNILLTDVTAFSLDTYDESNAQLSASLSGASCDPIRRIEISITLTRQNVSETLGTKLLIRSTMSGIST